MNDLNFQQAFHANFLTWNALNVVIAGLIVSVTSNFIYGWLTKEHLPTTSPLPGKRLVGYLISTILSCLGLFLSSIAFGSPTGAALVVILATILIGLPMTLLLDRFLWMRSRFGGDTIVDSISLGLLGFIYSLLVLFLLGLSLQLAFR